MNAAQRFVVVLFSLDRNDQAPNRGGQFSGGEVVEVCPENPFTPRPIKDWHEDLGPCLWWSFPIEEPPYCGTPLDNDFPPYLTHFTWVLLPSGSIDGPLDGGEA